LFFLFLIFLSFSLPQFSFSCCPNVYIFSLTSYEFLFLTPTHAGKQAPQQGEKVRGEMVPSLLFPFFFSFLFSPFLFVMLPSTRHFPETFSRNCLEAR